MPTEKGGATFLDYGLNGTQHITGKFRSFEARRTRPAPFAPLFTPRSPEKKSAVKHRKEAPEAIVSQMCHGL